MKLRNTCPRRDDLEVFGVVVPFGETHEFTDDQAAALLAVGVNFAPADAAAKKVAKAIEDSREPDPADEAGQEPEADEEAGK